MNGFSKEAESIRMKQVWDIFCDPEFRAGLEELSGFEKDRRFCRHDEDHLLAVARLAYIFSLERGYKTDKTLIYAAALLHDCGRAEEYKSGIPHDRAGAGIAFRILSKYDFTEDEIERILAAVMEHRDSGNDKKPIDELSEVIHDADKLSRNCFSCTAKEGCRWSDEKKNLSLMW